MIVLIGFMGAGKTTIGRMLADRIGLEFVDTDEVIERSEGRPISEIFGTDGEARFRTLERAAVADVLQGPERVVSLGGGAITDPSICAALEWHTVVYLDTGYQEAMRRIGKDPGRPLLHVGDPKALFDERDPIYRRLATHVIGTSDSSPADIVDRLLEATGVERSDVIPPVRVDLGPRSYPVFVGSDISASIAELVQPTSSRAFVVTHQHLTAAAKPLIDSLATSGAEVETLTVDEGEASKSLEVAGRLFEEMARLHANRNDLVVGFGGGVVCDLAGFVASTYHRGIKVVQVPTTLLAQVDASIGGKTAVNLPVGKNLVGTFHQPSAVLCDVSLLRSLPEAEMRSGLGEVIKYGLIADPSLLDLVASSAGRIMERDEDLLTTLVRRSVTIKAGVVSMDEHETGRREILNYGHTFGHAIEHSTGLRHGEAIAVGMMAAAHLSVQLGMLDDGVVTRHRSVLEAAGLPTRATMDTDATFEVLKQDKKSRGGFRFVLLDAIGSPRTGVTAADEQVRAALRSVTI